MDEPTNEPDLNTKKINSTSKEKKKGTWQHLSENDKAFIKFTTIGLLIVAVFQVSLDKVLPSFTTNNTKPVEKSTSLNDTSKITGIRIDTQLVPLQDSVLPYTLDANPLDAADYIPSINVNLNSETENSSNNINLKRGYVLLVSYDLVTQEYFSEYFEHTEPITKAYIDNLQGTIKMNPHCVMFQSFPTSADRKATSKDRRFDWSQTVETVGDVFPTTEVDKVRYWCEVQVK